MDRRWADKIKLASFAGRGNVRNDAQTSSLITYLLPFLSYEVIMLRESVNVPTQRVFSISPIFR
jgi:hypothetical protein